MGAIESEIEVIFSQSLPPGASTSGITRHKAFDRPGIVVSQSRIAPGVTSDWHHHAKRSLYGFLVVGELRFDYGAEGKRHVQISAGDYFLIPPGLVHRDVNPTTDQEAMVVGVLVGEGPTTVNTSGPSSH